jgi:DNA polymerase-3 subunit gamma/tau
MDVREIDGASNRGIDEIRELRDNVKFATVSCRYKIYIIDEVHMLTREAFNALLKTLEEPPSHVIFIFATTEIVKVPMTIRSRCQCYDFRRISQKQIKENLKKIAADEHIEVSESALSWIAEAGDGSLRDSQSIFDQVISYAGTMIKDEAAEEILGRSDRRFLFLLSEAVFARDAGRCLKIIEEAYYLGLDMRYFYQTLVNHFRNLLIVKIVDEHEPLIDLPAEETARLRQQVKGQETQTLQRLLEILMADEENARRSQNPRLSLEAVLCRMAYLEPMIPLDSLIARMEALEKRLTSAKVPMTGDTLSFREEYHEPLSKSRVPSTDAEIKSRFSRGGAPKDGKESLTTNHHGQGNAEKIGEAGWDGLKAFLKQKDPALSAKLESGQCLQISNGALRIGFEKGYLFLDDVQAHKDKLTDYCGQFFGRETRVQIEITGTAGSEKALNGNGRAPKINEKKETCKESLSSPLFQKILDIFPGAVVREVKAREQPVSDSSAIIPEMEPAEEELEQNEDP